MLAAILFRILFLPRLLSKNTILPVVLYDCEIWSLTLRGADWRCLRRRTISRQRERERQRRL